MVCYIDTLYKQQSTETHSQALIGIEFACQSKVNDLDAISLLWQYQDILGLQVEVDDAIAVYKGHGLAHLAYEDSAHALCENKLIVHNTIEELAAFNAKKSRGEHHLEVFKCVIENI